MTPAAVPDRDLERVADAQQRFEHAIRQLSDADLRRATQLPGWTVAHVLTHVARNADSHRRRADAAAEGAVIDQYPGGFDGRAAEIERGAARPRAEILADVSEAAEAMRAAWQSVPAGAWDVISRDVTGRERPLHTLPARRWQELEVHVVDVDVGVTQRDWPDDFVQVWLPALQATAASRLAPGTAPPAAGAFDDRDELAWLYGRLRRADLPELAPWR